MPQIDFTRDEVKRRLSMWALIRDCIAGQQAIKDKGVEYLPKPNAADTSTENTERYKAYKLRASFLNAVDNTVQGLLGQVFSADPVVELPSTMEMLEEDCDGTGVTLTQRAKKTLAETLALGRAALLTDFPKAPLSTNPAEVDEAGNPLERDFSREELNNGTARANILQFDPENVINWRTRMVGGKSVLCLVVIATKYTSYDDGFEVKEDNEWRVLKLDDANEYVCEVWRLSSGTPTTSLHNTVQGAAQFVLHDSYKPRDSTGAPLKEIPFTFVGSLNNNDSPDKPPMYDLAVVNIAHYRNSADYEDSVYMVGQGTPVATGLTANWVKEVWKDQPLQLGSRGVVPLPAGGDFKIVAMTENGIVKEAMDQKENQMAMLGAQLIEKKEVQRTLGEAQMEKAQIESVLVQCAKNTAAAIQKCLRWAALFYGENADAITYELSTDFAINSMTPEERKALIADYQGGLIAWEEARNALRQSGVAYLDDTKAKAAIDEEAQTRIDMAAAEAAALTDATGGEGNDDGGAAE
jgi:hypothetical protein